MKSEGGGGLVFHLRLDKRQAAASETGKQTPQSGKQSPWAEIARCVTNRRMQTGTSLNKTQPPPPPPPPHHLMLPALVAVYRLDEPFVILGLHPTCYCDGGGDGGVCVYKVGGGVTQLSSS